MRRRCGEPSSPLDPHAEWELPATPGSVGTIRNGVREFARARGGSDAVLIDLALAVTEAVTNSVVHAFIDREPGIVRARIQAAPDELVAVVTDNGRGMQPRADSPGSGSACRRSPRSRPRWTCTPRPAAGPWSR